jgi:hypothetical protein
MYSQRENRGGAMLIHLDDYRKQRMAPAAGADQQPRGRNGAAAPGLAAFAAVLIFRKPRRRATEAVSASALAGIYPLAARY